MKHNLIFIALLLVIPSFCSAKTVYVNNVMGDDRFSGEREDCDVVELGPVKTIAQATRIARQGDTISLANTGAPYQECVSLVNKNASGVTHEYPFILEGNGAALDGREVIAPEKWEHDGKITKRDKQGKVEVQGDVYKLHVATLYPGAVQYCMIFVDMMPVQNKAIPQTESPQGQLNELDAALSDGYLYFRPEKGKTPFDYTIEITALRTGITLSHVNHVVIRNLIIQGFQLDGVALANSASDVTINKCTVRGNGRAGTLVGGASDATFHRVLSCANAGGEILTLPYSKVVIENSKITGDYGAPWVDNSGDENGSAALFCKDGKWIKVNEIQPDLSEEGLSGEEGKQAFEDAANDESDSSEEEKSDEGEEKSDEDASGEEDIFESSDSPSESDASDEPDLSNVDSIFE